MESKKSIRSGAGPFGWGGFALCAVEDLKAGRSLFALLLPGSNADLDELAAIGFPLFFASCCAKYCLLFISKSGSFKYSSNELVKLVGACLSFGISKRVEFSYCLATLRNRTTRSVCLLKFLYILKARSASYFDISK